MDYKSARFKIDEVKEAEDKEAGTLGEFGGYLSIFGNEDLGRDIVERGAFSKTLQERPEVPLLWQHFPDEPIGKLVELGEDDKGLRVKGMINLQVKRGQEAYALMKQGALTGMSIGYDAIKSNEDKGGKIRRLQELKLWEGSVVTFPMNQSALVDMVKNRQRETSITEVRSELKAIHDVLETQEQREIFFTPLVNVEQIVDGIKAGRTLSAQNVARIRKIAEAQQAIADACMQLLSAVEPDSGSTRNGASSEGDTGKDADPDLVQSFFTDISTELDRLSMIERSE